MEEPGWNPSLHDRLHMSTLGRKGARPKDTRLGPGNLCSSLAPLLLHYLLSGEALACFGPQGSTEDNELTALSIEGTGCFGI